MIRQLQKEDVDEAAKIWLDANLEAHDFIPPQYWKDNFKAVKEMLAQGELYVCEDEDKKEIQGFVGLSDDYIAGIFVRSSARSRGIGKMLTDYAKSIREQLTLNVYQKNLRAVKFYQREGFHIQREGTDENTGEKEYGMCWSRNKEKGRLFQSGKES